MVEEREEKREVKSLCLFAGRKRHRKGAWGWLRQSAPDLCACFADQKFCEQFVEFVFHSLTFEYSEISSAHIFIKIQIEFYRKIQKTEDQDTSNSNENSQLIPIPKRISLNNSNTLDSIPHRTITPHKIHQNSLFL